MRISDADRNGTLRRLHNAVALGLIDIEEFEERSAMVSRARLHSDLDTLVGDLPGPGAIVTSAADRVELRGVLGSLKRQGEWVVPTPAGAAPPHGFGGAGPDRGAVRRPHRRHRARHEVRRLDLRLPDGASASIDDVEVIVGSAHDHRKDAPAEGTPARHPDRQGGVRFGGHPRSAQVVPVPRPLRQPSGAGDYLIGSSGTPNRR